MWGNLKSKFAANGKENWNSRECRWGQKNTPPPKKSILKGDELKQIFIIGFNYQMSKKKKSDPNMRDV